MAALVRHEADAAMSPPFVAVQSSAAADSSEIERLYAALERVNERDNPRTAHLVAAGCRKKAQKLMEEAAEVALEAVRYRPSAVIRESADLVYQMVVLWHECGVAPDEVWAEMRRRAQLFGIAEKLPKAESPGAASAGRGIGRRDR